MAIPRALEPRQLRALAHPLRLRLLAMLRTDGPSTATVLGKRLGESSGATSYHLRQLAEHDLIEEAPGLGKGRERWWRARTAGHSISDEHLHDPDLRGAVQVLLHEFLSLQTQQAGEWLAEQQSWDREWVDAANLSSHRLHLTAAQLRAMAEEIRQVIDRYQPEPPRPGTPVEPGKEHVAVFLNAFPRRTVQPEPER